MKYKIKLKQLFGGIAVVALAFQASGFAMPVRAENDFQSITICHQEGNSPYIEQTINSQGQLNGHDDHENDIIPAPAEGCPTGEQTPPPPPPSETPPPPPSELPPPPPPVDDEGCEAGPGYATSVVSNSQGLQKDGNPVSVERTNPASTLGAPDSAFYSLGKDGTLTLSFAGFPINITGDDVELYEVTFGDRMAYPEELARVEISQDGVTWVEVGIASNHDDLGGVTSQDISGTGLSWLQYVRFTDLTDLTPHEDNGDGYDLDAVYVMFEDCAAVTLQKEGSYNSSTGEITYTIDWTVIGDGSVSPLTITDVIPTGTDYVDGSADNGGTFDGLLNKVTWDLGTKNSGDSGSVSFDVEVEDSLLGNPWATSVVSFSQGVRKDGSAVLPERSDSGAALHAAESLGLFYDTDIDALIGKFVSLGFTDEADGGSLVVAFDQPVINGAGNDLKVFEITGGQTGVNEYPDEEIRVEVSDDNATWTNVGVIVRDGEVDFGLVASANYVKVTSTADKNIFPDDADSYDVDAIKALHLIPTVCSIENTALATWYVNETEVFTTASTETILNESACEDDDNPPPPPGPNPPPPPQGGGQGSVTGIVFNDLDEDGVKDENEEELSGWVVYLDTNDNGNKDEGEVSDTTESPYLISGLTDGTYNVRQVLQNGWTQVSPADKHVVVISGGNAAMGFNFANHQTQVTPPPPGGGGGGGGGTTPPPPPPAPPTGLVLGDVDMGGIPDPQTLGNAVTLPRTGAPLANLVLPLLIPAAALLIRKKFKK